MSTPSLKEMIQLMQAECEALDQKRKSEYYVVAGYGGEVLYAFVDGHRGFNGADLIPDAHNPYEFSFAQAQDFIRHAGRYWNGYDKEISLFIWNASDYYFVIQNHLKHTMEVMQKYL